MALSVKEMIDELGTALKNEKLVTRKTDSNNIIASGLQSTREALIVLAKYKLISTTDFNELYAAFTSESNDIKEFPYGEWPKIEKSFVRNIRIAEDILRVLSSLNLLDETDTVNVSIPENYSSFNSLADIFKTLHRAIAEPLIASKYNITPRINSVSNGSYVFNIAYVAATAAVPAAGYFLKCVGDLIKSGLEARKLKLEGDKLIEEIKQLSTHNKAIDMNAINEAQIAKCKGNIAALAQKFVEEHYDNKEQENVERVKHSINLISDELLSKGILFLPPVTGDHKNKAEELPTVEQQMLIADIHPLLKNENKPH